MRTNKSEQAMSWDEKAREAVSVVNAEYSDETFVSEGYGYFDDIVSAMTRLAKQAYESGLEDAAKVAEQYWRTGKNMYARHSGRAVQSRIRSLKSDAGSDTKPRRVTEDVTQDLCNEEPGDD